MAVDGSENICDSKMLNTLVLVHIRHSSFVEYRLATKFICTCCKDKFIMQIEAIIIHKILFFEIFLIMKQLN